MKRMPPRIRKLALTIHVIVSVGWLGGVAAFLVLAVAGLTTPDPDMARSAYVSMDLVARHLLVPLSLATLASGLVQSLGTDWGLLRHYWVIAKLLITVVSTALLLLHLQPIAHLADAANVELDAADQPTRIQLMVTAALAIVALVAATLLSVFKPRGTTPRGRRHLRAQRKTPPG